MTRNTNLHEARKNKNDEFYTLYSDIEDELKHYTKYLEGKVIYCNCDDFTKSNFYKYFEANFDKLKLKKLYASCYPEGWLAEYDGERHIKKLEGDGDFRSEECVEILKKSDVIITNPPFSLFRQHFDLVMNNKKLFLSIGNLNAVTYKNIFPYLKTNEVILGANGRLLNFETPNGTQKLGNVIWFTNMQHNNFPPFLELTETYYG